MYNYHVLAYYRALTLATPRDHAARQHYADMWERELEKMLDWQG